MDIKAELKMLADYFGGDDHIAAIIVKAAKVIESQENEISDLHEHCASLKVFINKGE